MGYYTSAGPKSGTILWRDDWATIDVLRDPGDRDGEAGGADRGRDRGLGARHRLHEVARALDRPRWRVPAEEMKRPGGVTPGTGDTPRPGPTAQGRS